MLHNISYLRAHNLLSNEQSDEINSIMKNRRVTRKTRRSKIRKYIAKTDIPEKFQRHLFEEFERVLRQREQRHRQEIMRATYFAENEGDPIVVTKVEPRKCPEGALKLGEIKKIIGNINKHITPYFTDFYGSDESFEINKLEDLPKFVNDLDTLLQDKHEFSEQIFDLMKLFLKQIDENIVRMHVGTANEYKEFIEALKKLYGKWLFEQTKITEQK